METFTFAQPAWLLLFLLVPALVWWQWRREAPRQARFRLSAIGGRQSGGSWKARFRPWLFGLKIVAFGLLTVAMARPQTALDNQKIEAEGIDIVLVLDVSGSMLAADFTPDRLEASKTLAKEFIQQRSYDRIGLVVFSGESFTQCPLTTDQTVLLELIDQVQSGILDDGTAIGMGLATAVTRLKDSQAKSKVVILLTDGVNNAGFIDPLTAAETAQQFAVKCYTIGVGTHGEAPYPVQGLFGKSFQMMPVEIDEALLEKIAAMTGGRYFRATDNEALRTVYEEIDRLEKTTVEVTTVQRRTERFLPWVVLAGLVLLAEWLVRQTLLRGLTD